MKKYGTAHKNSTQLFYDYLDVQNKEAWLNDLKESNLIEYNNIQPLITAHEKNDLAFTSIVDQHLTRYIDSVPDFKGHTVDKFKVGEKIGEGGMSVVYRAERENKTFEQSVAIKFFRQSLHRLLDNSTMFNEAQMLARLNHPHIVKVFDGGNYQGINYLVMEQVRGRNLNEFLAEITYDEKQCLTLFLKICSAVAHAHQHQTVHADLKPENILVEKDGTPKIIDFNMLQRVQHDTEESAILAVSPVYASPEQIEGKYLTNTSDIYALGKILNKLMSRFVNQDLQLIINKATREEPTERYQFVELLANDIRCYLDHFPTSLNRSSTQQCLLFIKRRPLLSSLSLFTLFSTISLFTLLAISNQKLESEKETVEKMLLELTSIFHYESSNPIVTKNIIEVAKKRLLSNASLPEDIRHKLLFSDFVEPEKKPLSLLDCSLQDSCK
ncbi:serine/threonine-protein kinase [Vibrio amylolyticus]|uniref:serine/threonine-protein kinase n=1 Tax=Vibrio amylolyticus TaxID=2847292 RepID=UPI0035532B73